MKFPDMFSIPSDDEPIQFDKKDIVQVAELYNRYGASAVLRTIATLVEVDKEVSSANKDHILSRLLFSTSDAFDEAVARAANHGSNAVPS